jgi:hypothetical protein
MRRDQLMQTLDSRLQQEEARLREFDAAHPKSHHKMESGIIRAAILKQIDTGERTRRNKALQVWLITIIPPVTLLLLGTAIGCAVGGFRKETVRLEGSGPLDVRRDCDAQGARR